MATARGPDLLLCYYCSNEATDAVDYPPRGGDVTRRWVCAYHAQRSPRRRRWRRVRRVRRRAR